MQLQPLAAYSLPNRSRLNRWDSTIFLVRRSLDGVRAIILNEDLYHSTLLGLPGERNVFVTGVPLKACHRN